LPVVLVALVTKKPSDGPDGAVGTSSLQAVAARSNITSTPRLIVTMVRVSLPGGTGGPEQRQYQRQRARGGRFRRDIAAAVHSHLRNAKGPDDSRP
jgi:hypothetical protein